MLKLWRSRQDDLETYRDITDDVEESEFVPFACHFNPNTLLTKNGELLQTIKITGIARDTLGSQEHDLRNLIRKAVRDHIPSSAYALWFHTIRRKRNLSAKGSHASAFARDLNAAWEDKNHFHHQYTNEVYLTIVREGQDAPLFKKEHATHAILPNVDLRWRNSYLDDTYQELDAVAGNICEALHSLGAERIGIYEENGIYYSELLEFLEKLTNLMDRKMPVPEEDLSSYLTSGEITFGFNAMEVRVGNKRRFSSIVSLKEYKEISLGAIDSFLQSPMEFIVTQCVDFINPDIALKQYLQQKAVTRFAEDSNTLSRISELDAILESNRNSPIDFGQQQLSIFLIGDSLKQVELQTKMTIDYFKRCGLVAIREDLYFEKCYWAQLPGNFEFIARLQPTYTQHTAGFANLHNFPMGNEEGSLWGPPVTTFHTANGTPYFFNFHDQQNGHTWLIGKEGTGKTVLGNFLMTQATKFQPQIFCLDTDGRSRMVMEKLDAEMHDVARDGINPFSLTMSPANKQFLCRWLSVLARITGKRIDDAVKPIIERAVEHVLMLPVEQRHFASFIETFTLLSPESQSLFAEWMPGGVHGTCFAARTQALPMRSPLQYFALSALMQSPNVRIPTVSLLLYLIEGQLNGKASILYFGDSLNLLNNTHVSMNFPGWLAQLSERNAVAFFLTDPDSNMEYAEVQKQLVPSFATQIYMPDTDPSEIYEEVYGLNDDDVSYLSIMESGERHFLIKQRAGSIVAELNMEGMEEFVTVLSGKEPFVAPLSVMTDAGGLQETEYDEISV